MTYLLDTDICSAHLKQHANATKFVLQYMGGATPKIGPDSGRKASARWNAGVRWIPSNGGVLDGPGVIEVDLASGEARRNDTP